MPKSRIARSCYCSIFNFSQNFHIVYNSTYTNLHSYQQWTRVPFFPHLHQNLLFLVLSATAFLTNMRWYHIIVLICISLMINNVEHLFMHLLAICMCFWKKISSDLLTTFNYVFSFFFFAIELYELAVGLPFPSPGNLLDPGLEPTSPELASGLAPRHLGSPLHF